MPKFNLEGEEKEAYVEGLFASIASRYDLLNTVMSFGRHRAWRRQAVALAGIETGSTVLDVATGTGDFALDLYRAVGPDGRVVGVDFCSLLLKLAGENLRGVGVAHPTFLVANAERLPFADATFDCATIGFALRNVADVQNTIAEMARVVRSGGRVLSVEITGPDSRVVRPFWRLYFNRVVPVVGGLLGSAKEAYTYLPESVERFYTRQGLKELMKNCGLIDVWVKSFALGTVSLHVGTKP